MHSTVRLTLITLALGLSACTVHEPYEQPAPPIERLPPHQGPVVKPLPGGQPSTQPSKPAATPKPMPRTSASFAPPPGGSSHWDPKLGVYVLEKKTQHLLPPAHLLPLRRGLELVTEPRWPMAGHRQQRCTRWPWAGVRPVTCPVQYNFLLIYRLTVLPADSA